MYTVSVALVTGWGEELNLINKHYVSSWSVVAVYLVIFSH